MKNDDTTRWQEGAYPAGCGPVTRTQEETMNAIHPHLLKNNETIPATSVAETAALDTRAERRPGLGGAAPDPAVVALAEYREAKADDDAFSDDEAVAETPEYIAAGDRRYAAGRAVYDAVPTSLAGVVAKIRFLLEYEERGNDLWVLFDHMAKSMLPFLEGGAAAVPMTVSERDPVVALFAKLGAINDEAIAIHQSDPERTDPKTDRLWNAVLDRRDAVLDQIMETPAESTEGVAIKTQCAIKAADAESQTVGEKERKFLAAYRRLSRAQAQAMRELVADWHNGVGPDLADVEPWVRNRAAEIEALTGAGAGDTD